ncbi:MAG: protein kinase [Planctomycetes bacterium]|nr:protein kinase [Planctomycetota bacterium]
MAASDGQDDDEIRDAFLDAFWADVEAGRVRGFDSYRLEFPGADSVIAEELESLEARDRSLELTELTPAVVPAPVKAPREIAGYRVVGRLGAGGMGQVLRVRDPNGRDLALKMPIVDPARPTESMRRFRRELRLALSLQHDALVPAVDGGIHDDRPYLVTEVVEGANLAEVIQRAGRLGIDAAAVALSDLLEALSALEARGIIHRDLKPANVLVDGKGRCRLADLGLARSVDPDRNLYTFGESFLGTVAFASPEQLEGRSDLDTRCDLFALGATVFAMLVGHAPQLGRSLPEVVRRRTRDAVPDLRSYRRDAPEELAAFVAGLTRTEREQRPPTAAAASEQLRSMAFDEVKGRRDLGTLAATLGDQRGRDQVEGVETWLASGYFVPLPTALPPLASSAGLALDTAAPTVCPQAVMRLTEDAAFAGEVVLHAGQALVLGGRRQTPVGGVLELPFAEDDERARRISARQLSIRIDDEGVSVEELGSAGGTKLDGRRLETGRREFLGPTNEIELAGVLNLRLRITAGNAQRPALWIEDPDRPGSVVHALVPQALPLDATSWIERDGEGFYLHDADGRRPLAVGESLRFGRFVASVLRVTG